MKINTALERLEQSKFRSGFHLSEKDKAYIREKGLYAIKEYAADFVEKRLAPKDIPNDGKQTPMRGHPVFVAQHAIACCCRGCLNKWYKIPKDTELTAEVQDGIVRLLMAWIVKEMNR